MNVRTRLEAVRVEEVEISDHLLLLDAANHSSNGSNPPLANRIQLAVPKNIAHAMVIITHRMGIERYHLVRLICF